MKLHVVLRDAFGTDMAKGDLTSDGVNDDQLREWLEARAIFPLVYSTPHPHFPLEIAVTFDQAD